MSMRRKRGGGRRGWRAEGVGIGVGLGGGEAESYLLFIERWKGRWSGKGSGCILLVTGWVSNALFDRDVENHR